MSMITYVAGRMELIGEWTQEEIDCLNEIRDELAEQVFDEFTLIGQEIGFAENARNSYHNNLSDLRIQADDLSKLLKGQEGKYIEVGFSEDLWANDESESCMLEGYGKIYLKCEDGEYYLVGEIVDEEQYWKDYGVAYDNYEKRSDECPECGDYRYECDCGFDWEAFDAGDATASDDKSAEPTDYKYSVDGEGITIEEYVGDAKELVIPRTIKSQDGSKEHRVVAIGWLAFEGNQSLKSITLPDSVTSIGEGAFKGCESLGEINVCNSNSFYQSIDGVLFDKKKIALITYPIGKTGDSYLIPDGVTSIGDNAFSGCESLKSITISDGVTSIGDSAFEGCSSLVEILVCNSNSFYQSIDGVLFDKEKIALIMYPRGKTGDSYLIPDGVTSIGKAAFVCCKSLKNITIPGSVTSIGYRAFEWCVSLESITIPGSVKEIGPNAFSRCESLKNVTISDGVTSIGHSAFEWCESLESITIPGSVKEIGPSAFEWCKSLKNVTISDGVTSIGDSAFAWCKSLESITIPGSVKEIDASVFSGSWCESLTISTPQGSTAWEYAEKHEINRR